MPTNYINTPSGWKAILQIWINTATYGWKSVSQGWINTATLGWKQFFSSTVTPSIQYNVSISQSTNGTTYLVTLTGTNYYWIDTNTLFYKFEQSVDNATTWTTLSSGTATNPSSGLSNTYTYQLVDNLSNVTPNIQNIYRFVVTGTSTTYSTSFASTSNTTSVYGPENITITTTGKSYNSVDLNWTSTAAAHAQKYLVYYKLSTDSTYTFSKVIATTSTTVDSLYSSTAYNFKVVPITGVSNTYKGYRGNDSNVLTITTNAAPVPTQLTSPTINGSGYAFTAINGTSGTYQSGTFQSKVSYIRSTTSAASLTSGLTTTPLSGGGSPPYNVTQLNASAPKSYFYYVDEVTANDGVTVYYYYSSTIDAKIGQVTDDFTRTVSAGLGIMTPAINSAMSPNAYTYNLSANNSTWSTNGTVAVNTTSVSGTTPSTYNLQSLDVVKTNLIASVQLPGGPDGLGIAFWVTSGSSWWASTVHLSSTSSSSTTYSYYTLGSAPCNQGPFTTTGTPPTNCSQSSTSVTTYTWNQNVTTFDSYECTGDGAFSRAQATGGCDSSRVGLACSIVSTPTFSDPYYRYKMCVRTSIGGVSCTGGPYRSTTFPIVYCNLISADTVTTTTYYTLGSAPCNQGPFTSSSPPSTYCGSYSTNTTITTIYNTNLKILYSNGSSVNTEKTTLIGSSSSGFIPIAAMKVITSGDSITATVYSDNSMNSSTGSHSHTATGSTKALSSGFSATGIIKTPHGYSQGIYFDNLQID